MFFFNYFVKFVADFFNFCFLVSSSFPPVFRTMLTIKEACVVKPRRIIDTSID